MTTKKTNSASTPTSPLYFDHIAVGATTLDEGAAYIQETLGIVVPAGGKHPRMGTHNLLMSLGPTSFLEVIAIDPDATSPMTPRWYNLDRFQGPPRILTWVVGTDSIHREIYRLNGLAGEATQVSRGNLTWDISVPSDGSMPLDGAFPTLLQWPRGTHVAASMGGRGCSIKSLKVRHPEAQLITNWLGNRYRGTSLKVTSGSFKLEAEIETPQGSRILD